MTRLDTQSIELVRTFFNDKHEIILCSASSNGRPNAALMGSCRLSDEGHVEFEISDPPASPAQTFQNIQANKQVMFMRFVAGPRARDYKGLRIYANVSELHTSGAKLEAIREKIAEKHGAGRASETIATVLCTITEIRPLLDRQQDWKSSV